MLRTAIADLTAPGVKSMNRAYDETKTVIELVLKQHNLDPQLITRMLQEVQAAYAAK